MLSVTKKKMRLKETVSFLKTKASFLGLKRNLN